MPLRVRLALAPALAALLGVIPAAARAADPAIKVVLAGDSTVAAGSGWGPALGPLFGPGVEVVNLARSGASSKSYRDLGLWTRVLAAKPDWVLVQFGHNDQPGKGPARETDPNTTFPENLGRFVDEARAAGGRVVLVTPVARRTFGPGGKVATTLTPYADAAIAVGKDKKVPVVDLHARSIADLEAIGPGKAAAYDPPPTEPGKPDRTHLSAAGAAATAGLVADGLRDAAPDLGKRLK